LNDVKVELDLPWDEREYYWGRNYLDEVDHIFQYHENIVEDLEKMQSKIMGNIFDNDVIENNLIIPFPKLTQQEFQLAATEQYDPLKAEYYVEGVDDLTVVMTQVKDTQLCTLHVFDNAGNFSSKLDGAQILNAQEKTVATIQNTYAEFDLNAIDNGCLIKTSDGVTLHLHLKGAEE
jgi:hypothetical protein